MPIYCDEAGSNGNDLLEKIQPYFTYAALNISESEAEEMVKYLKVKHRLQGIEPKGINMVKTRNGQAALLELYERYSDSVKIVYHHKKYALSCKFFEYIFEPIIADVNSFFYKTEFNKFIANFIFDIVERKGESAELIFVKFQDLIRGTDFKSLFDVFASSIDENTMVRQIFGFARFHKDTIREDLLLAGEVQPWILDLAQTAFYDLLIKWQRELKELTVICDDSKPLRYLVERGHSLFEPGQEVRNWNPLGKEEIPINFKLTDPIRFSKSREIKGLQLADMFASSAYYHLKNPKDEFSNQLAYYLEPIFFQTQDRTVIPQPDIFLNTGSPVYKFGKTTLKQLYDRSLKGKKNVGTAFLSAYRKKHNISE